MRILFLIAAIVAVFMIVRTLLRRPPAGSAQVPGPLKEQGTLVRCEHCGEHIPPAQVVHAHGQVFCSSAHAEEFAKLGSHRDGPDQH